MVISTSDNFPFLEKRGGTIKDAFQKPVPGGQTIKRTFHQDNQMEILVRHSKYSSQEISSLKDITRDKMRRSGRTPTGEDWKEIAGTHDTFFSDTKVLA
jgi:hypothetical protein